MNYDFHIHTCLSACADDDMTPSGIVETALANGLGVIAVADYNSCGNCRAVVACGARAGLVVIPGMELITAEGIHMLCLFPDTDAALAFSLEVAACLPDVRHDPASPARQLLVSPSGQLLGQEERLLEQPTTIGLRAVPDLVMSYGGICAFAHLDRDPGSALSVLEDLSPLMSCVMATLSPAADPAAYVKRYPFLSFYVNSDARRLSDIARARPGNKLEARFSDSATFIRFLRELPI